MVKYTKFHPHESFGVDLVYCSLSNRIKKNLPIPGSSHRLKRLTQWLARKRSKHERTTHFCFSLVVVVCTSGGCTGCTPWGWVNIPVARFEMNIHKFNRSQLFGYSLMFTVERFGPNRNRFSHLEPSRTLLVLNAGNEGMI